MIRNLGEIGINLQKILTRLQSNQNLLKLLYYTDKDPLSHPDLTTLQIQAEVFEKLIKIVPKVGPKETANSLIEGATYFSWLVNRTSDPAELVGPYSIKAMEQDKFIRKTEIVNQSSIS